MRPWHSVVPAAEMKAAELDGGFSMSHYLARDELFPRRVRAYRLSVVTNSGPRTRDVVERKSVAGSEEIAVRPLGLSWPDGVYSLPHLALPFAPDDPLFGNEPAPGDPFRFRLGTLQPRGERAVLAVPVEQLMRLMWNPFFPHLEERVRERAALPGGATTS